MTKMSFDFLDIKVDVLKTKFLSSNVSFLIVISVNTYVTGTKFHLLQPKFDVKNIKTYLFQTDVVDLFQAHPQSILGLLLDK